MQPSREQVFVMRPLDAFSLSVPNDRDDRVGVTVSLNLSGISPRPDMACNSDSIRRSLFREVKLRYLDTWIQGPYSVVS